MFAETEKALSFLLRNIEYVEERQKEGATKRKRDQTETRVNNKNDSSGMIAKYHNVL